MLVRPDGHHQCPGFFNPLVGYEHAYHRRAAGMRTYGLVCMVWMSRREERLPSRQAEAIRLEWSFVAVARSRQDMAPISELAREMARFDGIVGFYLTYVRH